MLDTPTLTMSDALETEMLALLPSRPEVTDSTYEFGLAAFYFLEGLGYLAKGPRTEDFFMMGRVAGLQVAEATKKLGAEEKVKAILASAPRTQVVVTLEDREVGLGLRLGGRKLTPGPAAIARRERAIAAHTKEVAKTAAPEVAKALKSLSPRMVEVIAKIAEEGTVYDGVTTLDEGQFTGDGKVFRTIGHLTLRPLSRRGLVTSFGGGRGNPSGWKLTALGEKVALALGAMNADELTA